MKIKKIAAFLMPLTLVCSAVTCAGCADAEGEYYEEIYSNPLEGVDLGGYDTLTLAEEGDTVTLENENVRLILDRATGGAYVKLLNMDKKSAEIAQLLTEAAGTPCTFRAAIEGTVAESDKSVLAAQQEAREQAQSNLNRVFEAFGRENVRVVDDNQP